MNEDGRQGVQAAYEQVRGAVGAVGGAGLGGAGQWSVVAATALMAIVGGPAAFHACARLS